MKSRHLRNVRGFFSDYYLGAVSGQGMGSGRPSGREMDYAFLRFLRIRERARGGVADTAGCREKFLRPFLRDTLGFHLGAGEDRIHGLYTSAEAEQQGERPLLVAYCGGWDEDLDAGRGAANPRQGVEQAIARLGLHYGLLLTGERLRLIRAQGEGARGAYLEINIEGLAEDEDSDSFPFLLHFFSAGTFTPSPEGKTVIEEIERESRAQAEKVSDDLKRAVFTAAESIVSGLIEDAVNAGRFTSALELEEADIRRYRDAALTCLYRILFILYAEARDTRLDSHALYRDNYSAQGLLDEVLEDVSFSWPANRSSLWMRLRALFRIYDKGLPRISQWENIPPRGSDFFSSETPEGEILRSARLSDRAVARLMLDLATSTPRPGVGRERVSFRELDIENLGAVYEGLLEFEPRVARETTLELQVQGRMLSLTPGDVVRLCEKRGLVLQGNFALVADTVCASFHPQSGETEDEEGSELEQASAGPDPDTKELEADVDAGEDEENSIEQGVKARIIRRLEPGTFHFVPGSSRKGSGSFYTSRPLVQDLVRHSLGPLLKGKSSAEIERLRVLDPACGSAHFLVEAMRFVGQFLHRAYVEEGNGRPPRDFRDTTGQGWDIDWRASDESARLSNSEARAWCKRRVAERCLFGVDLNSTAVGLARVALWIESAAGDRPLTYFEHHVRCGNSLLGSWTEGLDRPPLPGLGSTKSGRSEKRTAKGASPGSVPLFEESGIRHQIGIFQDSVRQVISEAARKRRLIDEIDATTLRQEGREPESIQEQKFKDHLRRQADEILEGVRLLFDLRSSAVFLPEIWAEWDYLCDKARLPEELLAYAQHQEWWPSFEMVRARERFFHWELEFPEAFLNEGHAGFDVVLGNPPWDKIKPDRKEFFGYFDVLIRAFKGGELDKRIAELAEADPSLPTEFKAYEERLKRTSLFLKKGGDFAFQDWNIDGKSTGGDPDLFKFFVERAFQLATADGRIGFVVPSAIYNNEGCSGLRHLLLDQTCVDRFYGFENRKKIFPIDSRYKFVSLVFRKTRPEPDSLGFSAAFMRHDLDELDETALWREPGREGKSPFPAPMPWIVSIRRDELYRLSPGTLGFLEYRSPRDREIILKMYEGHALLGDQGRGTWNARFYREFDMANDRDLWTDPKTGKLWNTRQILGEISGTTSTPPYYQPASWPDMRARMAQAGFWPLYEGKHIEQFLVDIKPIVRWVNLDEAEKKNGRLPDAGPKLVFRDIASNTNERTCIAAVLSGQSCFGHSLSGLEVNDVPIDLVAAVLNSMAFDYCLRFRTAGMHLSFNYMMRLPIVSSVKNNGLTTVSGGAGRICHIAELADSALKVWQLNRAVAEAYGLSPDDFEHVLSAFTVFIRKRPEFFAFMRSRANEWKEGSPYFIDRSKHYVAGAEQESWAAEKSRAKYSHDQQSGKTRIGK